MNQVATIEQPTAPVPAPIRRPEVRVVSDPIAVLDTARFEHMQRIASVMARSNLIPDSLCMTGSGDNRELLPLESVTANCFLVVNQAVRWNMDPFAVAQCVSVVHGKLCYEGKLIAAVIEARLSLDLEYEITGIGDSMKVVVSAATKDGKRVLDSQGKPKTVTGTVAEWKTTGKGSPWDARGGHPRMLRYRGAREWGRVHSPGLMLGVYSDDEMEDLSVSHRANTARVVNDGPPAPPQITAQPQQLPVEALVEQGHSDPSQVEWTEPAAEQESAPEKEATTEQDIWFFEEDESQSGAVAGATTGGEGARAQAAPPQHGEKDLGGAAAPSKPQAKLSPLTGLLAERHRDNLVRQIGTLETVGDLLAFARDGNAEIDRLPDAMAETVRAEFNSRQNRIKESHK